MPFPVLCAALVIGLLPACAQADPAAPIPTPDSSFSLLNSDFHRGIALGLYHADPEFSYTAQIEQIADVGADSISLIVVWMQSTTRSTEVYRVPGRTVPDERLVEAIRAAHAHGLRVMLFPIVLLENPGEGEWRGRIRAENLERWFASYRGRVLDLALLAEREGVEVLCIGSELSDLEDQTERWRRILASVRQVYRGEVTYSANWDHLTVFGLWDELDFIGMSAYFVLAEEPDVPEDWLDGAWRHHRNEVLAWRDAHHLTQPIVLTEVGYASQDGTSMHPWDYTQHSGLDLEEQRRCYAAFIRVWDGVEALGGVYFYEWGNGEGGPDDDGYTPRGKPAEALIRGWYQRGEVPALTPDREGDPPQAPSPAPHQRVSP